MEHEKINSQKGLELVKELFALSKKYIEIQIDGRELISCFLHIAKINACLAFNDYNYMTGCLSNCLHDNLEEMYEDTKKWNKKNEEEICNQSPAPIADTTSCEEI